MIAITTFSVRKCFALKVSDKQVKKSDFPVKKLHILPNSGFFFLNGLKNKLKRNSGYVPSSDVRSDTRFMLLPLPFSAEITPQENGVNILNSRHSSVSDWRFLLISPAAWLN